MPSRKWWLEHNRKKRLHHSGGSSGGSGGPVVAPSDPTPAPSLTAPVLAFVSATDPDTDTTQDFTLTITAPQVGEVLTLQWDDNSDFSSVTGSATYTVILADLSDLTGEITTGALAVGAQYFRAKHSRGGTDSAWSNSLTKTIAASFTPLSLFAGGEKGGWWDGSDLTKMDQTTTLGTTAVVSNGDPIGYWGDKSGNLNHMIQATAGARPVLSANGIDFVSSDFVANNALANAITGLDLWACAVVRFDTLVNGARIISSAGVVNDDFDSSSAGILLYLSTATMTAFRNSSPVGLAPTTVTTATKYLVESSWSGTANRITQAGSAGTPVASSNSFDIRKLAFGTLQTTLNAAFHDGQIAEVIIIDRVPSGAELTDIRTYLNTKWSI